MSTSERKMEKQVPGLHVVLGRECAWRGAGAGGKEGEVLLATRYQAYNTWYPQQIAYQVLYILIFLARRVVGLPPRGEAQRWGPRPRAKWRNSLLVYTLINKYLWLPGTTTHY